MASSTISPLDFAFLGKVVLEGAGIVLDSGKEYLALSRLEPLARKEQFEDITQLVNALRLKPNGPLRDLVIDAMTTNETLFFRDSHPFDAVTQALLPEFIRTRAATRTIDIWCAAASTGQEPYSIAMLLREQFPELRHWRINITGTDISKSALERARLGRYSQLEVSRGLPAKYMIKYFTRDGTDWVISEDIRSMVSFKLFNLAATWPPMRPFDIVLMRNVLIYFNHDTKEEIVNKSAKVLRPDGALILGSTESLLSVKTDLQREVIGKTVFYKPKAPAMAVSAPISVLRSGSSQ